MDSTQAATLPCVWITPLGSPAAGKTLNSQHLTAQLIIWPSSITNAASVNLAMAALMLNHADPNTAAALQRQQAHTLMRAHCLG
jgi:hypothetical protein